MLTAGDRDDDVFRHQSHCVVCLRAAFEYANALPDPPGEHREEPRTQEEAEDHERGTDQNGEKQHVPLPAGLAGESLPFRHPMGRCPQRRGHSRRFAFFRR